jgi:hypothetical protein
MKLYYRKNSLLIFVIIIHISIFIDYKLFICSFLLFLTTIVLKELELSNYLVNLIKLIPINYYAFDLFKLFNENSQSVIFWDMQNFIHYLKCNSEQLTHNYKFNNILDQCPSTIGYGPLTEYIKISGFDIWNLTLAFAITFTVICIIFLFKSDINILLLVTIFISPSFQFLYYSLNSDIFVVVYLCWILNKNNYKKTTFSFIILAILSLIKTYPVLIYFGYLLLAILSKNRKEIKKILVFFTLTLVFLINHYLVNSAFLPDPISFTRSFGVLHDIKLALNYIGFDEVFLLGLFTIIFATFFRKYFLSILRNDRLKFPEVISEKVMLLLPMLYLINFYQNWGYKFIFNSILGFIIFSYIGKSGQIFIVMSIIFAITYFFIGWGFTYSFINLIAISVSKISFYMYLLFTFFLTFNIYKNLQKN